MLVKAGSGVMTAGGSDSAGVPEGCAKDTLTARYNDLESVKSYLQNFPWPDRRRYRTGCGKHGVVTPKDNFAGSAGTLHQRKTPY